MILNSLNVSIKSKRYLKSDSVSKKWSEMNLFKIKKNKSSILYVLSFFCFCFSYILSVVVDPECQHINKKHQCYFADPSCRFESSNGNNSTTHSTIVYASSVVGSLIFLIIIVVALKCIWKKIRHKNSKNVFFVLMGNYI